MLALHRPHFEPPALPQTVQVGGPVGGLKSVLWPVILILNDNIAASVTSDELMNVG